MKKLLNNKAARTNLLTYLVVVLAFLAMQLMNSAGMLGSSMKGFLVPICVYISLAVSLNLLVGVCGELSLGHAGFMGIGAFSGILIAALLKNTIPNDFLRLLCAMLGGILLGIIETFSKAYLSTQFSDAIVFSVLIIILLVKPAGLLGKQMQEKV